MSRSFLRILGAGFGLCIVSALIIPQHATAAGGGGLPTLTISPAQSAAIRATSYTLNTLTYSDSVIPSLTAANNLIIQIPAGLNAVWDQTVTAPTYGGTLAGLAGTASYTDATTLVIDITGDAGGSGTLTIDGLKFYAINYASLGTVRYSINGGGTTRSGFLLQIIPATLTSSSVALSSYTVSDAATATAAFTTTTSTPADAKIVVTFPDSFNVSGVTSSSCPGMGGTFGTGVVGQVVTITRSGGVAKDPGAKTCRIDGVVNPGTAGTTATYTFEVQVSTGEDIESDSTVSGSEIVDAAAPASSVDTVVPVRSSDFTPPAAVTKVSSNSPSGGGVVTFWWTNPPDLDFSKVRIYRSRITGVLGDFIGQTTGETYTDSGLVPGERYYYLLRTVDKSGNERVDAIQYEVLAGSGESPPGSGNGLTPIPTEPVGPGSLPASGSGDGGASRYAYPSGLFAYDLIRGTSSTIVYFLAKGERYVFPNEMVYNTWFPDFSQVKEVSSGILAGLPLGGVVRVRPGTVLLKVVSDPRVYAVEPDGSLRWIENETLAAALYGADWNKKVRDLDVGFFAGYSISSSIKTAVFPLGSVVRNETGTYYLGVAERRQFASGTLAANGFSPEYVVDTGFILPNPGAAITAKEADLADPVAE